MAVWAISVIGIVLLTVLCDAIMPDGETKKYVKTVEAVIAVFVMISPVPKILSGDITPINFGIEKKEYAVQENYLEFATDRRAAELSERCQQTLAASDVVAEVEIFAVSGDFSAFSAEVTVDFEKSDAQMTSEGCKQIKDIVAKILGINTDEVHIREKNIRTDC